MSSGMANIDLVEILFTLFWVFFIGLVYYLQREMKREGYPLVSDRSDHITVQGFPAMPSPKTYYTDDGRSIQVPRNEGPDKDFNGEPAEKNPGAPLNPTGDPLTSRLGPGAWANRPDIFEKTLEGAPRIVPLRVADGFAVDENDIDPRGMDLVGADDVKVGTVSDLWIDLAEPQIYFLELASADGNRLVPFGFADIDKRGNKIRVKALYSNQFANVPQLANPDQITMLEEDKIVGYFGGGLMFADSERKEPLF
ncbi:MAG: photosynthetic reaction center subunit H [Pseudomonadota bacterium]